MKKYIWLAVLALAVGFILLYFFYHASNKLVYFSKTNQASKSQISPSPNSPTLVSPSAVQTSNTLAEPIAQFKERITKKPFGIYITPQNSPVQPERFSGFHTGADVEYEDVTVDMPVDAISDGIITYSNWVSGYGGVLIIKVDIKGDPHSVLYGHLRPGSLPAVGTNFKKGEQMAVLGTSNTSETDGERHHLHFSVLSDDRIDLKGYVQNQSELSGWTNPLSLY